ncbi:MAG: TetR family transcriptional regulator [Pseudonocardiaceae bacterium]|nr:TetR family transcriptional regulator [Pseudonocardiaceae bacterium]
MTNEQPGTTEQQGPANYLSRSMELLWGSRERPSRGPKPGLTLDRIVETAISVADTDGLDALSMRRVARELGVGTMSLYRYVPGRAELLVLMLERVSDPSEDIDEAKGRDWRGILAVSARGTRRVYLEHPWLLQVNWTRPVFGPNVLAGVEFMIAGLANVGLDDQERISVMMAIDGYVTGTVRTQVQYASAAEESGVSDEEFWKLQYPILEQAMESGRYPALAGLAEDAFDGGMEESFEFGLQRLLDGIEALIESRRSRRCS